MREPETDDCECSSTLHASQVDGLTTRLATDAVGAEHAAGLASELRHEALWVEGARVCGRGRDGEVASRLAVASRTHRPIEVPCAGAVAAVPRVGRLRDVDQGSRWRGRRRRNRRGQRRWHRRRAEVQVHPDGEDLVDRPILARRPEPSVSEPAQTIVSYQARECSGTAGFKLSARRSSQALVVTAWPRLQAHYKFLAPVVGE